MNHLTTQLGMENKSEITPTFETLFWASNMEVFKDEHTLTHPGNMM